MLLNVRLLIIVILIVVSSRAFPQIALLAHRKELLAKQNNPGYRANNFQYAKVDRSINNLYQVRANHILLFFYNPECDACQQFRILLENSKIINDKIRRGMLKVLAIYVDRDISIWKQHLREMPQAWIQGRDENEYLYSNGIYDLHAIPTIYLLDRNKRVILKDVLDVNLIEMVLSGSK